MIIFMEISFRAVYCSKLFCYITISRFLLIIGFSDIGEVVVGEIPCRRLVYDLDLMAFLELEEEKEGIDWFAIYMLTIMKFL